MRCRPSGATTPRRPSSDLRTRRGSVATGLALAALCAVLPVALAAPASASPAPAGPAAHAAATRTVKLKDSYFSPASITSRGKTTLRFVWAGELRHNLVGRGIPERYARPRTRYPALVRTYGRGVWRFSCTIHPGMEMKLRVR